MTHAHVIDQLVTRLHVMCVVKLHAWYSARLRYACDGYTDVLQCWCSTHKHSYTRAAREREGVRGGGRD